MAVFWTVTLMPIFMLPRCFVWKKAVTMAAGWWSLWAFVQGAADLPPASRTTKLKSEVRQPDYFVSYAPLP